jgi:hypothetical protein
MNVTIEFLSEPNRGRILQLMPDKPLVIKTQKSSQGVGDVTIEVADGRVVMTNRSRLNCKVNGKPQSRTVLSDRDRIEIGKQQLSIAIAESDPEDRTQRLPALSAAAVAAVSCSVCDASFKLRDHEHGWVRGDQRICSACLSKGVKPEHLPRHTTPLPMTLPLDTEIEMPQGTESSGSRSAQRAPPSESDRQRRTKRISVSRLAQVTSQTKAKKPGLLTKVGRMFGSRDDANRLEELERERRELLLQAGRLSLTARHGPAMPDQSLIMLMAGQSVVVRLQDFSVPAIEQWRDQRQRLALLEAEIAVLRQKLDLGPDPELAMRNAETLASDRLARQERAFVAMDELGTDMIEDATSGEIDATDALAGNDTSTAEPSRKPSPNRSEQSARNRSKSGRRRK